MDYYIIKSLRELVLSVCINIKIATDVNIILCHFYTSFTISIPFNPKSDHNRGDVLILQIWKLRLRESFLPVSYRITVQTHDSKKVRSFTCVNAVCSQ